MRACCRRRPSGSIRCRDFTVCGLITAYYSLLSGSLISVLRCTHVTDVAVTFARIQYSPSWWFHHPKSFVWFKITSLCTICVSVTTHILLILFLFGIVSLKSKPMIMCTLEPLMKVRWSPGSDIYWPAGRSSSWVHEEFSCFLRLERLFLRWDMGLWWYWWLWCGVDVSQRQPDQSSAALCSPDHPLKTGAQLLPTNIGCFRWGRCCVFSDQLRDGNRCSPSLWTGEVLPLKAGGKSTETMVIYNIKVLFVFFFLHFLKPSSPCHALPSVYKWKSKDTGLTGNCFNGLMTSLT